jgi:hypothetical protein
MSKLLNLGTIEVPVDFHSSFAQRLKGVKGVGNHRRVVLNYDSELANVIADMRETSVKKSDLEKRG